MDSYDTGRLIYLVLLGSVIAAYFFVSNRDRLGQAARQAVLWGLIFLGVIAGYGLWGDIRNEVLPRQAVIGEGSGISVPRAPDGHFYLTLDINGKPFHVANIVAVIVIGVGAMLLAWLSIAIMLTGAKIVSWTSTDREAVKRVLEHALGSKRKT